MPFDERGDDGLQRHTMQGIAGMGSARGLAHVDNVSRGTTFCDAINLESLPTQGFLIGGCNSCRIPTLSPWKSTIGSIPFCLCEDNAPDKLLNGRSRDPASLVICNQLNPLNRDDRSIQPAERMAPPVWYIGVQSMALFRCRLTKQSQVLRIGSGAKGRSEIGCSRADRTQNGRDDVHHR
jgi:hypothetical protein